jgi:hypothetical protein
MDSPISAERIDDDRSRFVPDGFKHVETPPPFIVQRVVSGDAVFLFADDAPGRQSGADLALIDDVREYLRAHPNSSQAAIQRELKKQKEAIKHALEALAAGRAARCIDNGKAKLWRLM